MFTIHIQYIRIYLYVGLGVSAWESSLDSIKFPSSHVLLYIYIYIVSIWMSIKLFWFTCIYWGMNELFVCKVISSFFSLSLFLSLSLSLSIYLSLCIYVYIYICVCVRECVCVQIFIMFNLFFHKTRYVEDVRRLYVYIYIYRHLCFLSPYMYVCLTGSIYIFTRWQLIGIFLLKIYLLIWLFGVSQNNFDHLANK